jgi:regulatory protein
MTQTITALTIQKRNKERVSLFLNGEYAFSLSLNAAFALKRGQCLSPADIERLQCEDEAHRATQHALHLLGYRPRSRVEIERHLHKKDYTPDAICAAIERLAAKQYVDDDAFARYWLEHHERYRPRGARAIGYELRQKGVDKEIIDNVLIELDEEASAWAAIERKLNRWRELDQATFRKKAMGFLSRRGFGYDTIRVVCQKAWATVETAEHD